MKFIIFLSALCIATNAVSREEMWSQYKYNHKKYYLNNIEEQLRYEIFQNNLKRIEEHNAKYDNGELSYYLAVNQFADMTQEEFLATLNKQIGNKFSLNATIVHHKDDGVGDRKDWRESDAVSAVKDQGQCGSCWAFSATGALESQLLIHRKQKIILSEQQLVDCKGNGCSGGSTETAFKFVKKYGLCSESTYPYTAKDGVCRNDTTAINTISGSVIVERNENSLKNAIWNIGPVSVGVHADDDWQLYGGGIFNHASCSGDIINHMVLAIGYETDNGTDKLDYWILKNSWDTWWGENGYMRLLRGQNLCGISNDALYPVL